MEKILRRPSSEQQIFFHDAILRVTFKNWGKKKKILPYPQISTHNLTIHPWHSGISYLAASKISLGFKYGSGQEFLYFVLHFLMQKGPI